MDNIYLLSDLAVLRKIGDNLKSARLKQNITQQSLSDAANVSISTVKKIEKGDIRSFDALLRMLRTLGKLDVLVPLVEEEQLSPNEYYELMQKSGAHQRKRATGKSGKKDKEESVW